MLDSLGVEVGDGVFVEAEGGVEGGLEELGWGGLTKLHQFLFSFSYRFLLLLFHYEGGVDFHRVVYFTGSATSLSPVSGVVRRNGGGIGRDS